MPRTKFTGEAIFASWSYVEECVECGEGAPYCEEFSDEQLILCDLCVIKGLHVKCYKKAIGSIEQADLDSPSFQWFCGDECRAIYNKIRDQCNKRVKLPETDEFSYEIVRYSETYRPTQNIINTAISIFHSAFGPTRYSDGTDLVEVVCQGRADAGGDGDDEESIPDCSGFFVLVLRKAGVIVSAATLRVQGATFAEVPYVATRDGYRREGNCRRLMLAVESFLCELGVQWMVMPAVKSIAVMWTKKFGFGRAGEKVIEALESRVLYPEGTDLLLKQVQDPFAPAPPHKTGTRTPKKKLLQKPLKQESIKGKKGTKKGRQVRFELPSPNDDEDNDNDDEEADEESCDGEEQEEQVEEGDEYDVEDEDDVETEVEEGDEPVPKATATTPKTPALAQTTATTAANNTPLDTAQPDHCCSNCTTIEARHWYKDETTGEEECGFCHSYRVQKGLSRPAALYRKASSWKPKDPSRKPYRPGGENKSNNTSNNTAGGAGTSGTAATSARPRSILKRGGGSVGKRRSNEKSNQQQGARSNGNNVCRSFLRGLLTAQAKALDCADAIQRAGVSKCMVLHGISSDNNLQVITAVEKARLELAGLRNDLVTDSLSTALDVVDTHVTPSSNNAVAPILFVQEEQDQNKHGNMQQSTTAAAKFVDAAVETDAVPAAIRIITPLPAVCQNSRGISGDEGGVVSVLRGENEAMKEKLARMERAMLDAEADKKAAQQLVSAQQAQTEEHKAEMCQLQTQLQAAVAVAEELKGGLSVQHQFTAKIIQQLEALEKEKASLRSRSDAAQHAQHAQLLALQQQLTSCQALLLHAQRDAEHEKKLRLEKQRAAALLETQYASYSIELQRVVAITQQTEAQLATLNAQHIDYSQQLAAEKQKNQELQVLLQQSKDAQVAMAVAERNKMLAMRNEMETAVAVEKQSKEQVQQENERLREELQGLMAMMSSKDREIERAKDKEVKEKEVVALPLPLSKTTADQQQQQQNNDKVDATIGIIDDFQALPHLLVPKPKPSPTIQASLGTAAAHEPQQHEPQKEETDKVAVEEKEEQLDKPALDKQQQEDKPVAKQGLGEDDDDEEYDDDDAELPEPKGWFALFSRPKRISGDRTTTNGNKKGSGNNDDDDEEEEDEVVIADNWGDEGAHVAKQDGGNGGGGCEHKATAVEQQQQHNNDDEPQVLSSPILSDIDSSKGASRQSCVKTSLINTSNGKAPAAATTTPSSRKQIIVDDGHVLGNADRTTTGVEKVGGGGDENTTDQQQQQQQLLAKDDGTNAVEATAAAEAVVKKKRGRPRKKPLDGDVAVVDPVAAAALAAAAAANYRKKKEAVGVKLIDKGGRTRAAKRQRGGSEVVGVGREEEKQQEGDDDVVLLPTRQQQPPVSQTNNNDNNGVGADDGQPSNGGDDKHDDGSGSPSSTRKKKVQKKEDAGQLESNRLGIAAVHDVQDSIDAAMAAVLAVAADLCSDDDEEEDRKNSGA